MSVSNIMVNGIFWLICYCCSCTTLAALTFKVNMTHVDVGV